MRKTAAVISLAALLIGGCGAPDTATETGTTLPETAPGPDILASGANIAGANGMHFGPDGNLYVASVVGSSLSLIDPDSGKISKQFTAAEGVFGPDDVAFAPDGSFYWTSILTGEVAGFDPSGNRIVAAQLGPGANPITFSPEGRLFVSQCFLGTNLYELDPLGKTPPRLISDLLGPGCGLNGMDWGPDNRLYGPRWFTGEVVSFNVDDNTMRVEATGLRTPAAVKFDGEGRLHVLDTATGEVIRLQGNDKITLATLEPGLDNFTFDDKGRIFVSSFTDGFVKRVNTDGSITTLQPGGMSHAGGVVVFDGNVVVADLSAIRGYAPATGQETLVQRNILGVSEMGGAMNVAVDGNHLILTSWFDGDVRIWDPAGQKRIKQYPGLSGPVAAVRYAGKIVVAEHGKSRVVALDDDGQETTLAAGLPAPTGLVVEQGDLYVSDRSLGQILMIASNGKPLETPFVVVSGLDSPEGFVMTKQGFVVVEAETGRVVAANSEGVQRELARIPPGSPAPGPGYPPSQVFNGIAQGPDGTLYIPGETNRVLYQINP
ncbi:MAG: hypothetical protein ACFHX7_10665 [Pseudomonadota bacterium]